MSKIDIRNIQPPWLHEKVETIIRRYCDERGLELNQDLLNERTAQMMKVIENGINKIASDDTVLLQALSSQSDEEQLFHHLK